LTSRLVLFAIAALLASSATASAASDEPSDDTIVNTIQCEAGRVGARLSQLQGFPANLKVLVSWKSAKTTSGSGGFQLNVPFLPIGGGGDLSHEDVDELKSDGLPFNLNSNNLSVCRGYKIDIIKEGIGVYDCLINKKLASLRTAVEGGEGSTGCHHQVTLAKKLKGSAKLGIWGVSLGPEGSWGDTYLFDLIIAAPARAKK